MNVLIVGASIAGPALAHLLGRRGLDVTVVERSPKLRTGGYAVDIRGTALTVIERLGLRERLRPLETDTLTNAVVDARGLRFGRTARGFGVIDPGDIEIMRGDLARELTSLGEGHATYRFGDTIVALEDDGRRVWATFADGERRDFDLVVGADGVHSRTRALAFGPERAFVRELGSAMAIFTVPNHLGLSREQLLFQGVGRIASVKCTDGDRSLAVCVFFSIEPGTFDVRDVEAQKARVARAFEGAGWEFPTFLAAMRSADDFYADITCQVRMDRFHRGRVALVGDAAFCPSPLSGQGTSLALVGAYVLAHSLDEARGDVERALAAYDDSLRDFVEQNQAVAIDIASGFAPKTPFEAWSRNAAMRVLPYVPGTSLIMKLAMRGVREAARAMTLPELSS